MDDLISHCVEEITLDGEQGKRSSIPFFELFEPLLSSILVSLGMLTILFSRHDIATIMGTCA